MQYLPVEQGQYPLVPTINELMQRSNVPIPASVAGLSPEVMRPLVPLVNKQLRLNEVNTRINALREVSSFQSAVASDWLRNRFPGERNIRIETRAESREMRWLFAKGERIAVSTQITIW